MPSLMSSSLIGSSSRSRKVFSSATDIFLTWWVTLRPANEDPSVQPFTVLARMTTGASFRSTAVL